VGQAVSDRPFVDPDAQPTEPALRAALGSAYDCYTGLLDLASGHDRTWTFSRGSGWTLKIHDRKKALLYLIPLTGAFRASMAIRQAEREAALIDDDLAPIRGKLVDSRKYAEGYALQFDVAGEPDLRPLAALVRKLIAAREA
jgi:hypothetical protein